MFQIGLPSSGRQKRFASNIPRMRSQVSQGPIIVEEPQDLVESSNWHWGAISGSVEYKIMNSKDGNLSFVKCSIGKFENNFSKVGAV